MHLPHFLIYAKSASEKRIACVCGWVLQNKELPICVCVIYVCVFPFSVSIEVVGGRGGEDLQWTFSASPQLTEFR